MDPHKYGLSAKGCSISLFSEEKYRNSHIFTSMYWPGGLYATPGFAGSRSGTPISSSWISMMRLG
jgi:sphinganine-1-phosphate aldolase